MHRWPIVFNVVFSAIILISAMLETSWSRRQTISWPLSLNLVVAVIILGLYMWDSGLNRGRNFLFRVLMPQAQEKYTQTDYSLMLFFGGLLTVSGIIVFMLIMQATQ